VVYTTFLSKYFRKTPQGALLYAINEEVCRSAGVLFNKKNEVFTGGIANETWSKYI